MTLKIPRKSLNEISSILLTDLFRSQFSKLVISGISRTYHLMDNICQFFKIKDKCNDFLRRKL